MVDARLTTPPAYRLAAHLADAGGIRRGRSWLVWAVTSLALGRQTASLAVVALVATMFAISREFARRP